MLKQWAVFAVTAVSIGAPFVVFADDTGFASSHDWVKVGGKTCFADHAHSGSGDGLTKAVARTAAIREWAGFTALEYGSVWARYSVSVAQRVAYTKAEKGWSATVEARPCRG